MTHTSELYQKAIPIIDEVLELPPEQQDEAIAKACGADSELERYLRGLLSHRKDLLATDEGVDVFKILRVSQTEEADPETFGPYRILRRLGAGGMSVVYLARQPNPQRLVALKVLHAAVSPAVLQREVETLARLRHPGIAHVYEAGNAITAAGSKPYFVMEFVRAANGQARTAHDGLAQDAFDAGVSDDAEAHAKTMTLRDFVKSKGALPFGRILELIAEVCDAVAYAHRQGVLHRDLKPLNVLVDHLEHPKIIDFGIAKLVGRTGPASASAVDASIIGTPLYMSPELLSGESAPDVRGDVYALGMIAYELLGSAIPFDMLTGEKVSDLRTLRRASPIPLSSRVKGIPRDMEAIVMKAIARDPTQRYDSATSLAKDIRNCLEKKPVSARPNTLVYRATCLVRRRPVISAATALALGLIGTAAFRAYQENAAAGAALALIGSTVAKADTMSVDGTVPTLAGVLDNVASGIDAIGPLHREAAAGVHLLLGTLYLRADPRGGTAEKAARQYRQASEIQEAEFGPSSERVLSTKNNVAVALNKAGRSGEAAALLKELIPQREKAGDVRGAMVSRGNYAAALLRLGQAEVAFEQFELVFEGLVKAGDKHGALAARVWKARAMMDAGYLTDAEELQRQALQRSLQQGHDFDDLSLAIMDGLSHCLIDQAKWTDAEVELRRMRDFAGRVTAPENGIHHAILSKLLRVQRERGDQAGYLATLKEFDAWEARYGDGS